MRTIGWWWSVGAGDPWWQFGATAGAILAWGRTAPQISICCRGWCSGWPWQRGETCDLRRGGRLGAAGAISISPDDAAATVAISGAAAGTTSGGVGAAATVSDRDFSADTVSATAASSAPTAATTLSGAEAANFRAGGAAPATNDGGDATTFSARCAVAATIFRVNAAALHIRRAVTTTVGGVDTAGLCAVGAGAVATWDVDATVCSTGAQSQQQPMPVVPFQGQHQPVGEYPGVPVSEDDSHYTSDGRSGLVPSQSRTHGTRQVRDCSDRGSQSEVRTSHSRRRQPSRASQRTCRSSSRCRRRTSSSSSEGARSPSAGASGRRRRKSPPLPKPQMFSGKAGEWNSFIFQFAKTARYYGWNQHDKADRLLASLRGKAVDFIWKKPREVQDDYQTLRVDRGLWGSHPYESQRSVSRHWHWDGAGLGERSFSAWMPEPQRSICSSRKGSGNTPGYTGRGPKFRREFEGIWTWECSDATNQFRRARRKRGGRFQDGGGESSEALREVHEGVAQWGEWSQ